MSRGNPAKWPDGKTTKEMIQNHRASRMTKRTVAAIASGDEEQFALTLRQGRELSKLRNAKPWMCKLADQEFSAVGRTSESAYRKQSDLIDHDDPHVSQAALRQYFSMTTPRQVQSHKLEARYLHAVIEAKPEDLQIAARKIEESDV